MTAVWLPIAVACLLDSSPWWRRNTGGPDAMALLQGAGVPHPGGAVGRFRCSLQEAALPGRIAAGLWIATVVAGAALCFVLPPLWHVACFCVVAGILFCAVLLFGPAIVSDRSGRTRARTAHYRSRELPARLVDPIALGQALARHRPFNLGSRVGWQHSNDATLSAVCLPVRHLCPQRDSLATAVPPFAPYHAGFDASIDRSAIHHRLDPRNGLHPPPPRRDSFPPHSAIRRDRSALFGGPALLLQNQCPAGILAAGSQRQGANRTCSLGRKRSARHSPHCRARVL